MKHVLIMPRKQGRDSATEGMAVYLAMTSGECDRCPHQAACRSNCLFVFPSDAYCMKLKARLIQQGGYVCGVDLAQGKDGTT